MSRVRKALGPSGLALLPICCLGVPLLIAAGVSVAALALIAGITLAVIVCAGLIGVADCARGTNKGAVAPAVTERARRSS